MKKKNVVKERKCLSRIVLSIMIIMVVVIVGYLIFSNLLGDDRNNEILKTCGLTEQKILEKAKAYDRQTVLYKYFPEEFPLITKIDSVEEIGELVNDAGRLEKEEGCYFNDKDFIYIQDEDKVVRFCHICGNEYYSIRSYEIDVLHDHFRNVFLKDAMSNYSNPKYPNAEIQIYMYEYDGGDTITLGIVDTSREDIETNPAIGEITVNMATKTFTVKNY